MHDILKQLVGFEWDAGNAEKSWLNHGITWRQCEQVFMNEPLLLLDAGEEYQEKRYLAYGKTNEQKRLFIVFTVREDLIRVISARPMSRKERAFYDKNI